MPPYVWLLAAMVTFCCVLPSSSARSAATTAYQQANGVSSDSPQKPGAPPTAHSGSSKLWKDLSLAYRVYRQCANDQLTVCLKTKMLVGLDRVIRTGKVLRIMDGVQLVKSEQTEGATKPKQPQSSSFASEQEVEAVLPRALEAKEDKLNKLIMAKLVDFFWDRSLYLQMPFTDAPELDDGSSNSVEGRKKKDKKGGGGAYIMIPLLLGGTFVPIAYGALAMLAGKALIVSKLALVLASIIGIKKLLSGGGKESQHEVVVSGGHSGWGRDMDLAYSGWRQAKDANKHV